MRQAATGADQGRTCRRCWRPPWLTLSRFVPAVSARLVLNEGNRAPVISVSASTGLHEPTISPVHLPCPTALLAPRTGHFLPNHLGRWCLRSLRSALTASPIAPPAAIANLARGWRVIAAKAAGLLILTALGGVLLPDLPRAEASTSQERPSTVVSSNDVVRRAAAGEPIDLADVVVQGDVDLEGVGTLKRPLRCQRCLVAGSLKATDVVFERIVDLSDSIVNGGLELEGAIFKDRVSAERTVVMRPARFAAARFLGDASFTRGSFSGDAVFAATKFEGRADFAQRRFNAAGNFDGAVFSDAASFLLAEFVQKAHFQGAELRGGGSFRLVRLHDGAAFDRMSSRGTLEFKGAVLEGAVSFTSLTTSASVSLESLLLQRAELFMEQLSIRDLSMDVEAVEAVRGPNPRKDVLRLIERSAQERGDLSIANDARYQLLSLEASDKEGWLGRFLDAVFYRGVGGYLVRPLHPLVAFLVVLAVATMTRCLPAAWATLSQRRWSGRSGVDRQARPLLPRMRLGVLGLEKAGATVLSNLTKSLGSAFLVKPDIRVKNPEFVGAYALAGILWVEFLVYKLLLAVFLLALGNSSATIRQIIDTVRG